MDIMPTKRHRHELNTYLIVLNEALTVSPSKLRGQITSDGLKAALEFSNTLALPDQFACRIVLGILKPDS
jgi:hypothetical protein